MSLKDSSLEKLWFHLGAHVARGSGHRKRKKKIWPSAVCRPPSSRKKLSKNSSCGVLRCCALSSGKQCFGKFPDCSAGEHEGCGVNETSTQEVAAQQCGAEETCWWTELHVLQHHYYHLHLQPAPCADLTSVTTVQTPDPMPLCVCVRY